MVQIPIFQVTRQQKTPQKRKDSESEQREERTLSEHKQSVVEKGENKVVRNILHQNHVTESESRKNDTQNHEEVRHDVQEYRKSENADKVSEKSPKSVINSGSQTHKRRTRMAANFNFGGT